MDDLNDLNLNKKKTTQWNVEAKDCAGHGQTDSCNLYAAHQGNAELQFVEKVLICGCVLTPEEVIEETDSLLSK